VNTREKKKKRTSKKNVDGKCTSSHGNKTSRSRSVVKQKEMVFGFRKTATAVVGPEIDIFHATKQVCHLYHRHGDPQQM
jgi:hypothetical protein